MTRATTRSMYRSEEWARPSELRRRCALLHHGRNPGPTAYKYAARFCADYGVLPSEFERTPATKIIMATSRSTAMRQA